MCKHMLHRMTLSFLLLENKYTKKKGKKGEHAEFDISLVNKYSILYLSSMKLHFLICRETYVSSTVTGISVSSLSFLSPCLDFLRQPS